MLLEPDSRLPESHEAGGKGSIVVTILFIMLFISTILFGLVVLAKANLYRAYSRVYLLEAQYSAESGADAAIAQLNNGSTSYTGTPSDVTLLTTSNYKATFSVAVAAGSDSKQKIVTATGKVYLPVGASSPTFTRTIRVTVERTSTTTASGLMSRNIIDVDSSVKNIQAKEIYLNGFINLRSNSTNLLFEKLTVAGKDTSSSNCSVEGKGDLLKSGTLASGTKAVIDTAYNNCLDPPGNTSNTDFTVTANDSSVTSLQSTYIPWDQYMDSSYQNSPSGCNDWLAASPVSIPSTGNTKKTHYPDSGSGVATSCGTNGDLSLGSKTFNISDNVHIRANLCTATPCNPTFNNTSGSLKFVFIEGTIDFTTVHTSSGSSPIVFITYGADPGTHNKCPYGDSVYMSNNGSDAITAPAAYFLATNGVCIYQPKFGASPALGGLGGKNLYISSNSGSPFDLYLDPSFPVNEIPVDLAWRAVGYERL